MIKFYRIFVFIILISLPSYLNAHVEHYKDLNKIEFDIFRNGKLIGEHIFSFKKFENLLKVKSLINFEIKKLGVVLYKYNAEGVETYENNKLVHFKSKTNQNKKLNTDVWYDEKSLNLVKASFDKSGKWEYKLRNLE